MAWKKVRMVRKALRAGCSRSDVRRTGLAALLIASVAAGDGRAQTAARPSADSVMTGLQQKYKQDDKRFDALAAAIGKSVASALGKTVWLKAEAGGSDRTFTAHPGVALVARLAKAALADGQQRSRNSAETQKLLTTYPWKKDLELVQGLEYGSDRPVPENENGFINLRTATALSGYPELPVNQYLYGLDEIVGWQYRIKPGKKPSFEGRAPKDAPAMATTLPGWAQVSTYLQGELPDVPLLAIPWLTHSLNARLAERRKSPDGKPAPMDNVLAFLDSKWNGFSIQTPYAKDRVSVAFPVHALFTDTKGLLSEFPPSAHLASTGDMPFMSVVAIREYDQLFHADGAVPSSTPGAPNSFPVDSAYLARYKTLIDEIVRAVLAPTVRYPHYLAAFDFPDGKPPSARAVDGRYNVPRKYAVLLWAFADKDPVKVADFLHDNLLGQDANRFPADAALPSLLSQCIGAHEQEMLAAIAAHIIKDRAGGSVPGDFEREFSPYATYLDVQGPPDTAYLLHSFETFHESAAAVVRDAACALALKEPGA